MGKGVTMNKDEIKVYQNSLKVLSYRERAKVLDPPKW